MGSISPTSAYPFPFPKGPLQPTDHYTPLSALYQNGIPPQTPLDHAIIRHALGLMGQIRNLPQDERYIRYLGVYPGFQNGQQALRVIQDKAIQVEFGDMGNSPAHAQWISEQNKIVINQRYKGDTRLDTLYAISEAIYHEAGHAAGNGDGNSSVQEELNCLALNTLAYRYHVATHPSYSQSATNNPLLSNGVALYPKLFFAPDPQKQALINRVVEKYGDLPLESPGHTTPPASQFMPIPLAYRVKQQFLQQQNPPRFSYHA